MYVDNKNQNPYGGQEPHQQNFESQEFGDNILKPESQDHSDEAHYHKQ